VEAIFHYGCRVAAINSQSQKRDLRHSALRLNWSLSENRLNPELKSRLKLICVFVHDCVVLARVEVNIGEI